jgi:DNA-binding response OmpR family regulator
MKGKLFLIHWNPMEAQELASPLRAEGWDVNVEAKDGGRAGKMILTHKPDAIVIYLSRLPTHGCVTAQSVRSFKSGQNIPIIFVDGKKEAVQKTKISVPDGMFIKEKQLKKILDDIYKAGRKQI